MPFSTLNAVFCRFPGCAVFGYSAFIPLDNSPRLFPFQHLSTHLSLPSAVMSQSSKRFCPKFAREGLGVYQTTHPTVCRANLGRSWPYALGRAVLWPVSGDAGIAMGALAAKPSRKPSRYSRFGADTLWNALDSVSVARFSCSVTVMMFTAFRCDFLTIIRQDKTNVKYYFVIFSIFC